MTNTHRCIVALAAVALFAAQASAENWPHWRGPNLNSVSDATGVPTQWDEKSNVLWKLKLPGAAGSTPIVWGERIYLTAPDNKAIVLISVDTSGKELWRRPVGAGKAKNGASASPCTDGKHVWAYAGTGDLACFTLDGKPVWKTNLQERYGKFRLSFGMVTTPLLRDGRLYLQLIHSGGAWVVALDARTGDEVWKHKRESDGVAECEHSYASIQYFPGGNGVGPYLVSHGNDYAIAHRLADGAEVWRLGDLNPKERYNKTLRFVASPVATPGLIVVPTAKNGQVVGVDPAAKGKIDRERNTHERWRRAKGTPDVPTPIVHDGLVYLCRENGVLTCVDAKTGETVYEQPAHRSKHYASPVYADGHVYLTARDGTVTVVKAGRKFEVVSHNKIDDGLDASPAVTPGRVYLRGNDGLYAIGAQ